jgi:hypothetical protein
MDRCALSVCSCAVLPGESYCSEYCRQGASQGVQKNFCQCGHAHCEMRTAEISPLSRARVARLDQNTAGPAYD